MVRSVCAPERRIGMARKTITKMDVAGRTAAKSCAFSAPKTLLRANYSFSGAATLGTFGFVLADTKDCFRSNCAYDLI